ncbi:MAG: glycosyltransferase [Endomicrobium sp.]|jgi:glycosyltransferase involved in cell wall biosynthesis|nr:glycosyltransferase [Endomicrobium sp.]
MPKVSVIVPIYNVGKYVGKCLQNLVNQTLKDIEIICVDDCSTDNSMKIVEHYASQDLRIKIVRHAFNKGLAASRNTGLKEVSSDYIMFCDSDDFCSITMCDKMYNALINSNCEMAICGTNVIYSYGYDYKKSDKEYFALNYSGINKVSDKMTLKTNVVSWNKIYKKEIIQKYGISFPDGLLFEDAYFFFCYTRFCKNIYFLNEELYNYLRRKNSIMSNLLYSKDLAVDHLFIAEKIYDFWVSKNIFNDNKDIFFEIFERFLIRLYITLIKNKEI